MCLDRHGWTETLVFTACDLGLEPCDSGRYLDRHRAISIILHFVMHELTHDEFLDFLLL